MERFVNVYACTPERGAETINAWWRWKLRWKNNALFLLLVLLLFLTGYTKNMFLGLLASLIALLLLYFLVKRSRSVRGEQERIAEDYPDGAPEITVVLDDCVHMDSPERQYTFDYYEMEHVTDTLNMIVMVFKGDVTIAMAKDSFREGTAEECLAFLKGKKK